MSSVLVKGVSGNSFVFQTADFEDYCDLFTLIQEKDKPRITLTDYAHAVTLNARGRRINLGSPLDRTIESFTMILKSWTMGRNFENETFTAECPITLDNVKDATNCPKCLTIFERGSFEHLKICPVCRQKIM
jgi:hypothetical protein